MQKFRKDLRFTLHPYIFILRAGSQINEDFFDYSLYMMQLGKPETLPSPIANEVSVDYEENNKENVLAVAQP
ncbi:hypothetical protein BN1013_00901 [Candidatus Rubidus massiliensis]|nr:hypothetical protein BN1013_00901 [Candidatus Rubidus massiliensis]